MSIIWKQSKTFILCCVADETAANTNQYEVVSLEWTEKGKHQTNMKIELKWIEQTTMGRK